MNKTEKKINLNKVRVFLQNARNEDIKNGWIRNNESIDISEFSNLLIGESYLYISGKSKRVIGFDLSDIADRQKGIPLNHLESLISFLEEVEIKNVNFVKQSPDDDHISIFKW